MSNNEKFLQPLREICLKIEKSEDVHQNVADLKKYINKGSFYEYYSFMELLDVLARNSKLPAWTLKEIFKLLDSLLRDGTNNKDAIIGRCYNFIIEHKSRQDLINEFISIFEFKEEPTTAKADVLMLISEVLLRFARTSSQRRLLYGNYQSFIAKHATTSGFCLKYVQSINRTVNCFIISKKFNLASEFLEATLQQPLTDKFIPPLESDTFNELFRFFSFVAKYGHTDRSLMEVSDKITTELHKLLSNEHYKGCNDILMLTFHMCHKSYFNESSLKEICTIFKQHQKLTPVDSFHQKTATLISRLFANKVQIFEMTSACFSTFHLLSVSLFHIFKTIKNEEGVVSCCNDVKRHEVHNLINIVLSLACKLVAIGEFQPLNAKHLLYHVKYVVTICSEIKCKSKHKEMLSSYNRLYNLVYEFNGNKALIPGNICYLHEYLKTLYNLWNQLSDDFKATSIAPDALALEIYKSPLDKQTAFYSANGITSLMRYRKLADVNQDPKLKKKILLKYMCAMREATKLLGLSKATDFVRSENFRDAGFAGDAQEISLAEFIYLEISAIFRYSPGEDFAVIGQLFTELCSLTKDPVLLAQSSQMINDSTLKTVGTNAIKMLNKLLEEATKKKFDMEISLALALNNYFLYFEMAEAVASNLKEDLNKAIEKLRLQKELILLEYLNESLNHFTDVISHLMQNKNDLVLMHSTKRVLTILNNIALQYYIRGIKYKDLEAFTLLWHLNQIEDPSITVLLNIGTFFLDNHEQAINLSGNYIKISKKVKQLTVEEILAKLNVILDEQCIPMFESLPEATQCFILSFLLSSWVHNLSRGRQTEGFRRYDQFKKLWQVVENGNTSVNREVIRSKLYFCLVEVNMNCCNRSADSFLSMANGILMSVKTIDRDFCYQFQQIYHRITLKAINYSINRLSDMNHYDTVMASLILMAAKKGHCLKVLDLLSLSILRHLNMEKLDRAKIQLMEITKLLGLEEEILTETPAKFQAPSTVIDYDLNDQTVRKAVVVSSSPIQCELSMIYDGRSAEMSRQLESHVHEPKCVCEICKIPLLKFFLFQIGCHYSRLMWMMNKFNVSAAYNQFAIGKWRDINDNLRRTMDNEFLMINKIDFAIFSIRWLFQCADTLIKLERFAEIEQIYQEIELVLINNIPDFECIRQALHCRRENLNYLLEQEMKEMEEGSMTELSFTEFLKFKEDVKTLKRSQNSSVPTMLVERPEASTTSSSQKPVAVIYIDSIDDIFIDSKIMKKSYKDVKKPEPTVTPKPSPNRLIAKIDVTATPKPLTDKQIRNKTSKPKTTSRLRPEKTPKQSITKVIAATNDPTDGLSVATRRTRRKMT